MDDRILTLVGEFTWSFNQEFFIETCEGNFVWKDPSYGGDNSIEKYHGSYDDWLTERSLSYGRDKGTHVISDYTGITKFGDNNGN